MAGLGGSDKTGMTEEGVSGPVDRIRGKTCGLRTLSNIMLDAESP